MFGVGHSEGYHYYVMEFVDGCGLDQMIRSMRAGTGKPDNATRVGPTLEITSVEDGASEEIGLKLSTADHRTTGQAPDRFANVPEGVARFRAAGPAGRAPAPA